MTSESKLVKMKNTRSTKPFGVFLMAQEREFGKETPIVPITVLALWAINDRQTSPEVREGARLCAVKDLKVRRRKNRRI